MSAETNGPVASRASASTNFHLLVKPTGSQCNLDCSYCFYLHKEQLLDQPATPRMSDRVLEQHIRQYIESHDGPEVVFSWQGGEPTLAGLDYFRRIVELQRKHKRTGQRIENDLQTNGTLLDDDWCRFLKHHDFLVGLSIDGPRELHDLHRVNKGGRPTFDAVMTAVAKLHKHGVRFNALCVVNRDNARKPLDVYRFLRKEVRAERIQFIPCVEPRDFRTDAPGGKGGPVLGSDAARPGHDNSIVTDWTVDPDDWGRFVSRIWDEWLNRDYGRVFVDLFEEAVSQELGLGGQRCLTQQTCGSAMAIEHDGSIYSCDHFVYSEYRLGNILETHEADLVSLPRQSEFGRAKYETLPQYCRSCPFLARCWGECPKNRIISTPEGEAGLNYLCSGMKAFYAHSAKMLPAIAQRIRTQK